MSLDEFTQKFAGCFNQTDPGLIKPNTEYKTAEEWGSMLALIVIAMIDVETGKAITGEDLKTALTVADLYEIVKSK